MIKSIAPLFIKSALLFKSASSGVREFILINVHGFSVLLPAWSDFLFDTFYSRARAQRSFMRRALRRFIAEFFFSAVRSSSCLASCVYY